MAGPKLAAFDGLEFEDHTVTDAEHEFYKSFVVILEHLKNRALKAEAEVRRLRRELEVRREQVEVYSMRESAGNDLNRPQTT